MTSSNLRRMTVGLGCALLLMLGGACQTALADPASHLFSEDSSNPASWTGNRVSRRNRGAHTYYFRLPSRLLSPTQARTLELEVTVRGTVGVGAHAILRGGVLDFKVRVPSGSSTATSMRVGSITVSSPVVVLQVDDGVEQFSMVGADRLVHQAPTLPPREIHPRPVPSASPTAMDDSLPPALPPVPGGHAAQAWPAAGLSGAIPPGYADVYYYLRWGGGTMHLESTVTGTQGQVNFAPLAGGSSPYDLWTFAHTYMSPDGAPHTSPVHVEEHALAAGWYVVRVQAMTVSSSPARYTLRIR